MTNVSKRQLKREVQEKLFLQLVQLVLLGSKKDSVQFLQALFTESEKVMFVKRLATVLLLSDGYSSYRISKTLLMSESTVNNIRLQYETGIYDAITRAAKKKTFDAKVFWKTVDVILRAGMPSRGRDRWKPVFNNLNK